MAEVCESSFHLFKLDFLLKLGALIFYWSLVYDSESLVLCTLKLGYADRSDQRELMSIFHARFVDSELLVDIGGP